MQGSIIVTIVIGLISSLYFRQVSTQGLQYFISEETSSWGNSSCSLAAPIVKVNGNGTFVLNETLDIPSIYNEGVWVALFEAQIAFSYTGCTATANGPTVTVASLGDCSTATRCNTFGIRHASRSTMLCFCADGIDVLPETGCTDTCASDNDEYSCGAINSSTFSVYRVENVSDTECSQDCDENKRCLTPSSIPYNGSHEWEMCNWSSYLNILCSSNYSTDAHVNTSLHCFQRLPFPLEYLGFENTLSNITNAQTYWTGITKWPSIVNAQDNFVTFGTRHLGFIKQTDDRYSLEFVSEYNETLKRRSLCHKVKARDDDASGPGFSPGVIAGIAVPAVLLLILFVVLCKRKTIKRTSKSVDIENMVYDIHKEHPEIGSPVFVSTTSNFSASNPTYFAIEISLETSDVKAEETDQIVKDETTEMIKVDMGYENESIDKNALAIGNYKKNSLVVDNFKSSQSRDTEGIDAELQLPPPPPPPPLDAVETEQPICSELDFPLPPLNVIETEQTNDIQIETENAPQCWNMFEEETEFESECELQMPPFNLSDADEKTEADIPMQSCCEIKTEAVCGTTRLIENNINEQLLDLDFDISSLPTIEEETDEENGLGLDIPFPPSSEEVMWEINESERDPQPNDAIENENCKIPPVVLNEVAIDETNNMEANTLQVQSTAFDTENIDDTVFQLRDLPNNDIETKSIIALDKMPPPSLDDNATETHTISNNVESEKDIPQLNKLEKETIDDEEKLKYQ